MANNKKNEEEISIELKTWDDLSPKLKGSVLLLILLFMAVVGFGIGYVIAQDHMSSWVTSQLENCTRLI